jgi:acetyltransferase-like isoleucine patch superfamily enzyme
MKRFTTAFLLFVFPAWSVAWLLNLLGNKISRRARVGFSWIGVRKELLLGAGARIGHFNLIRCNRLELRSNAIIGHLNRISGPIDLFLANDAAIGNSNRAYRAPLGVTYGDAALEVGTGSKITGSHRIDLTRSVRFGNYSILAGHDSQLWTHGYYHDKEGPGRVRVDGEITVGNNVYIGTRCTITGGVTIADSVVVGANACVSSSLNEPGTYVNQPLRHIDSPADPRTRFRKITGFDLCEEVYERGTGK